MAFSTCASRMVGYLFAVKYIINMLTVTGNGSRRSCARSNSEVAGGLNQIETLGNLEVLNRHRNFLEQIRI